ncbi:flagellin [bacterium AH-315-F18]|nr:flagellin [bacterium AH-315-F18]
MPSITSFVTSFNLSRQLNMVNELLNTSSAKIASNKRILFAGDDPSGVVQVSKFRGQQAGLNQAVSNGQLALNSIRSLTDTTNGFLNQIDDQIDLIIAGITAVDQSAVDTALDQINALANAAVFGSTRLLDGNSASRASSAGVAPIQDLKIFQTSSLSDTQTLSGTVIQPGSVGILNHGNVTGAVSVEVTGPSGSVIISLVGGQTQVDLRAAIVANAQTLGVSSNGFGSFRSLTRGSDQTISLKQISGGAGVFTGVGGTAGQFPTGDGVSVSISGTDATGDVGGNSFTASGDLISFNSFGVKGEFRSFAAGAFTLDVPKGPLQFQLGNSGSLFDRLQISLPGLLTTGLGKRDNGLSTASGLTFEVEGFLESLRTGGTNDIATDATNAARIANTSKTQIASLNSFLGAKENQIQSSIDANTTLVSGLTTAISDIEDLDIAAETAEFTRLSLLFASTTSVLSTLNSFSSSVVGQLLDFNFTSISG